MTHHRLSALFVVAALFLAATAAAQVPTPTLIGPIPRNAVPGDPSHDYTFFTPVEDLSDFGYVEEEYFVQGTASRYSTPPLATGSVLSSGHPYKTRIVVRRPVSAKRFNGVVLLEWQNVTAGYVDPYVGGGTKDFAPYVLMIAALMVRPYGIFGKKIIERI